MKNRVILLLIFLSVYGCASAKKNFFPVTVNLPAYTGEVEIIDRLPEKYIDVGWINIKDNKTWIEMYQAAKEQAGRHGANAILYSPADCRNEWGGMRSVVCRAVYIEGK